MGTHPRSNRIPIMMSDAELWAVDDWRFENKIETRAKAIRLLVQIGLNNSQFASPAGERIRTAQDEAKEPVPATGQPPVGAGSPFSFIDTEDRSGEAA